MTAIADRNTSASGLLPLPVIPDPLNEFQAGMRGRPPGPPDPADPTDLITNYGHCASFCNLEGPVRGQTVANHGPYCTSGFIGPMLEGVDRSGDGVTLYLQLAHIYTHGVYHRADIYGRKSMARYVDMALTADGVEPDNDDG